MSLIVRNPTSVIGDMPNTSNTGHTLVTCCEPGCPGNEQCDGVWSGFSNAGLSGATKKTLKWTVTYDGNFDTFPDPASNHILMRHSLNGGSSFTNDLEVIDFNLGSTVLNVSIDLPIGQDLSQIQVEEFLEAFQFGSNNGAAVHSTVTNIRVEVLVADARPVFIA